MVLQLSRMALCFKCAAWRPDHGPTRAALTFCTKRQTSLAELHVGRSGFLSFQPTAFVLFSPFCRGLAAESEGYLLEQYLGPDDAIDPATRQWLLGALFFWALVFRTSGGGGE